VNVADEIPTYVLRMTGKAESVCDEVHVNPATIHYSNGSSWVLESMGVDVID